MSDGSLNFYEFPDNVTGGAAVPILGIPTPLATLTVRAEPNVAVSLRATVGWIAKSRNVNYTPIIFKIWRGAPVTGLLVVSVEDSGESTFDRNKVTTFSGVDSGFTQPQDITYVLTAELPGSGTAAQAIGGLNFTSVPLELDIPNRGFFFTTLPNNTVGGAAIPVTTTPTPLSSLLTRVNANDTVFLRATVGWTAQSRLSNVLFKIWRGAPFTGELVVSVLDSGESVVEDGEFVADRNKVTSFDGVDKGFTSTQDVVYVLTAETIDTETSAQVVGALTVTTTRYPQVSPVFSYYTLPDNTAGSVLIPITTTPQPITSINIGVNTNDKVVLRGTAGWLITVPGIAFLTTNVVFKLWRGAPVTGRLIFSVEDSSDFDKNKVTSFAHVDTGFSAPQEVTYVLTAELTNINRSAAVIGALTLTAVAGL
jgi:hypothetical protein